MAYTVKNSEIQTVLLNLPAIFSNRGLPVKIAYWLSRLQKELRRLSSAFDDERIKIAESSCLKNEDGKPKMGQGNVYEFDNDEIRDEVQKKIRELLNIEVEVGINKIDIEIEKLQGSISPDEIVRLEPFINFIEPK